MNPWDIDPSLYAAFWRLLRAWYRRRKAGKTPSPVPPADPAAGCRA